MPSKAWLIGMCVILGGGLLLCRRPHPNDDHTSEVIIAAIVNPSAKDDTRVEAAAPGRGLPSNSISDESFLETGQCLCSLRMGSIHLRYIGSVEEGKFVSFPILELFICQDRELVREVHDW